MILVHPGSGITVCKEAATVLPFLGTPWWEAVVRTHISCCDNDDCM